MIGLITCIAILLSLPATISRASWVAVVAGSLAVMFGQLKGAVAIKKYVFNPEKKRFKIVSFILLTCLVVVSSASMYYLKQDSANGRLLSWKMSLSALVQHPLGVGLGHFPSAYGETQSAYFASGSASETDEYVAGNHEYAFNEYLQIAIESGIVSLLLFIGMLVCVFCGLIKCKNYGVMGALVALLTFACFSYPFNVLPILIVFVFLLVFGGDTQTKQVSQIGSESTKNRSIFVICLHVCCITVTTFCLWIQYPVYGAYKQWKIHQTYYQMEFFKETTLKYEQLYPFLNGQIQFLFEYGRSLSQSKQPVKSNEVLQRAIQISCDPMLYNIMEKNYHMMNQYQEAEKCFVKSSNIAPNRIYPYYLMALMYVDAGEMEKAKEMAQIVLTKEPKVNSIAVKEIRSEMTKLLE